MQRNIYIIDDDDDDDHDEKTAIIYLKITTSRGALCLWP